MSFSIWVGFIRICRSSFCFLDLLFSGVELAESLLLLLELLGLVDPCLFLFLDLDLAAGIYLARLLTAFTEVAIDLLCFLYDPSSVETLSEVSIVAVLLVLLLDCSSCYRVCLWAAQVGCYLNIGIIFFIFSFIIFKTFDVRVYCHCIAFSFWRDYYRR